MFVYGVPGIGGRGWACPPKPDVAAKRSLAGCDPDRLREGVCLLAADEVRRRRCAPGCVWVEAGDATVMEGMLLQGCDVAPFTSAGGNVLDLWGVEGTQDGGRNREVWHEDVGKKGATVIWPGMVQMGDGSS